MKKKPNLFDFATSELSQDAFLAWLLSWANKEYQHIDPALHECASIFVRNLLDKEDSYSIESVEIKKQWNNIDVGTFINKSYFFMIEDKKGSSEHSDQLNRYAKIAREHFSSSDFEIKLIYFKMEEQGNYQEIESAGYKRYSRKSMLSLLKAYCDSTESFDQNVILMDYYEKLQELDSCIMSYLTKQVRDWKSKEYEWQGFYTALHEELNGNWNYVPNQSGGFLAFTWNWKMGEINGNTFEYYLQLEEHQLVFKLFVQNETKRYEVRDSIRKVLFKKANEMHIRIEKHGRLGEFMSMARLMGDYRMTNENGMLDFQKTLDKLSLLTKLHDEIHQELTQTENT